MSTIPTAPAPFELPNDHPWPPSHMTEEEFLAWCDEDVRAEWVDGEVIIMAPANSDHIDLNDWLTSVMRSFVEHHDLGRIFSTELLVRFAKQRRRRMPDLLFVAKSRLEIIKTAHIEGAPDMIVEIVSPDSESRDWRIKYHEYERAGVREYWIIDPMSKGIEAYALDEHNAYRRIETAGDAIASVVLPGFFIRPSWLWAEKRIGIVAALRELGVI